MTKTVSQAVYNHAVHLCEKMDKIFSSGMSEDMKLDFIFSEDIDWLQENIGFHMTKRVSTFIDGDIESFLKRLHSAISNLETTQPVMALYTEDIGNGLYT